MIPTRSPHTHAQVAAKSEDGTPEVTLEFIVDPIDGS
jgi:hypothetical protein